MDSQKTQDSQNNPKQNKKMHDRLLYWIPSYTTEQFGSARKQTNNNTKIDM